MVLNITKKVGSYVLEKLLKDKAKDTRLLKLESKANRGFIYTRYLPTDKKAFAKQLQSIMAEEEAEIQTTKLNTLIKIISNKAVGRIQGKISEGKTKYVMYKDVTKEKSVLLSKEELEEIGNATKAVFNSFAADVNKAKALGTYDKEDFEHRANIIAECEVARVTNKSSNYMARDVGIKYWIWGPSGSKNPREIHEILYSKKSLVGETPAKDGEFPGELPGCDCQMIYMN